MPRVVPSQVVELIDQLFPSVATEDKGHFSSMGLDIKIASRLRAIVELFEQIPSELIVLDWSEYSALVVGITMMRTAAARWQEHGGPTPLLPVSGMGDVSPMALVRRALSKCPDEFPSPGTVEMNFIQDQELRENLRKDISATNAALSNGEWKAATVLAGSIVEALLLWGLQQRPKDVSAAVTELLANQTIKRNPGTTLQEWTLPSYIEVAAHLNVISSNTAAQARLAKDFRNLIHPGRAERLGQTCNRGTALSAVAAVEHVIQDLARLGP